jgi:hypothetical protein
MTRQERDALQARYTQAKEKCEAIIVALRGHGGLCRQLGEFLYGYDHDRLMQADPSRSPRRRRRAVEGGPDLSDEGRATGARDNGGLSGTDATGRVCPEPAILIMGLRF